MLRYFILMIVAAAVVQTLSAAESLESAERALRSGDHEQAISSYEALIAEGNVQAMTRLAVLYQRGEFVSRDLEKAASYYRQAADEGDAEAQFNLGNLYLLGEGVPEDRHWAMTWYRQAAEQGHVPARHNLNQMLRAGEYDSVARGEAGAATAQTFEIEQVVSTAPVEDEQRSDQAAALELAEEHGINVDFEPIPAPAQEPGQALPAPKPVDDRLDAVDTAMADEDHARAADILQSMAADGHAEAQFRLAQLYESGRGMPPDDAMAITWYREAARRGHGLARSHLKAIYRAEGMQMPPLVALPDESTPPATRAAIDRERDPITAPVTVTALAEDDGEKEILLPEVSEPELAAAEQAALEQPTAAATVIEDAS